MDLSIFPFQYRNRTRTKFGDSSWIEVTLILDFHKYNLRFPINIYYPISLPKY